MMKKTLKISGIVFGSIIVILILLMLTPFLFKEKFAGIVKKTANESLKTEMNFSSMDVSFFRHFPNLTITLNDFSLKASAPFNKDTVVRAKDISFGINLGSLMGGPIKINKVYVDHGKVVLRYNQAGSSNFEVYQSSGSESTKDTTQGETASIRIEQIVFYQTDFIYADESIPMKIEARGINYSGKSDISEGILNLASKVRIDAVDFWYGGNHYLRSKPVNADLITKLNMTTLELTLEKNKLFIKNVPFEFKGELTFRKDGYSLFLAMFSMVGDEYMSGSVWLVSTKTLWISVKTDINVNIHNWAEGFGITDMDLRGMFAMKLFAQGEYFTGRDPASKKPDTVILSIPKFTLTAHLSNGYFKYAILPKPISGISFDLKVENVNSDYRTTILDLENFRAAFLENKIEGYFRLKGMDEFPVESHFKANIKLDDIKQVVPLDSLNLEGDLAVNLDINGKYNPGKKLFPVTQLVVDLKDGLLQTKYYPRPVEKVNVHATVINSTGELADTKVHIEPLSFSFEGNPFELTADLVNPDDLKYDIVAKGSIDLAGIYKLFSQKGMDLKGYIAANLDLKGKQSDAMAGRYDRLRNSGRLDLREIALTSEYLPLPLILKSGVFRFDNDNIWFEKFKSTYGSSDITMNGHLSNVVNYFLGSKQILKGSFDLQSKYLLVDEFMSQATSNKQQETSTEKGVIVIPDDLEIALTADLKKVSFQKVNITDLTAKVEVQKGLLLLKDMKFGIIGCTVDMNATYGSISPDKAIFDFKVNADQFDVKRAYNEIELFRNLSTSAGKCEGTISLDYTLKGKLKSGMEPVYPSLEGGGVLTLDKVKVMGLKLFTVMSKNLEKDKIKNPDLAKVQLKTTIKNNVITLERTKMKMAGFRFRVEGETNFNGALNLKARLGLPPLGIFGIPIRVVGTQENPKLKYGRGNMNENVEETEYSDEVPPEVLEKIKNAKEEDLQDETPEPK